MGFDADGLESLWQQLMAAQATAGPDRELPPESRRDQGAFFTPAPLVEFVARCTVETWVANATATPEPDGLPPLRVLDPAAGDGRFLSATALELARHFSEGDPGRQRALLGPARARCIGLERNPDFAALCAAALPEADVRHTEALLGAADLEPVDIVVGNPPYIRSIRLGESDASLRAALRGRYRATSFGEWDLYAAFIEQSVAWLRADGEAGLLVPSRWLTARSARELRRGLASDGAVRAIIDFGAAQVFAGATTYSSAVFLSARPRARVEVARRRDRGFALGQVATSTLSERPWRISVGRGRALVEAAVRAGPPLAEVARVAKGTGTNADRVYVIERGTDVIVEPDLVRPCFRGRDVAAYGGPSDAVRCIVPYTSDGELIAASELRARYPLAHSHFHHHRDRLERRERGRFRGEAFYQYGRPQNLPLLLSPRAKIVVPDVARDGRALLDLGGSLVLDSAYVVVPHEAANDPLILAVLNSSIVRLWLRETGIPLRGGYVRMKTAYLADLPVPAPSGAGAQAVCEAVRRGAPGDAIDELVRRAYDISTSDWLSARD